MSGQLLTTSIKCACTRVASCLAVLKSAHARSDVAMIYNIHTQPEIILVQFILFFKSSWCKSAYS